MLGGVNSAYDLWCLEWLEMEGLEELILEFIPFGQFEGDGRVFLGAIMKQGDLLDAGRDSRASAMLRSIPF